MTTWQIPWKQRKKDGRAEALQLTLANWNVLVKALPILDLPTVEQLIVWEVEHLGRMPILSRLMSRHAKLVAQVVKAQVAERLSASARGED